MLIIVSVNDDERFCETLISFEEFSQIKKVLPNMFIVDTKLTPDQISRFDSVIICAKLTKTQVEFE